MSSCFLVNPTCVILIARPGNSYEITEPNQKTSDPESRCIEYSFFNDHLHLKWFLLKIFCWLFKDPNTSQPIRKSWYCLLSLFMVLGSLTVAGSLLLYLTSHRRLNRYLHQYPLLPELSFFLGLSLSRWVLAIYFYNQVIYVIWFVESHCLVLYFTYKCRNSLQCRRFLWARNLLAKLPCWNFPNRGGDGASQREQGGGGEREEKTSYFFFSPPPPPFPSFALTPTVRVTICTLPIFHCHKIKDGGYNNITNTNKVSSTQNTPALQANVGNAFAYFKHDQSEIVVLSQVDQRSFRLS